MRFLARTLSLTLALLALTLLACQQRGDAAEPAATAPAATASGNSGTYVLDPAHTQVLFRVGHMGMSRQWGRFDKITGSVSFDEKSPEKSAVAFSIDAVSVNTNVEKRDAHLRSPDFLNAREFPAIAFKSTKVRQSGPKSYDVTGNLTLHGVTKEITVPFTLTGIGKDPRGRQRAGGESTFKLSRSAFGVSGLPGIVGDEVELFFTFEGVRQ